MRLLKLAILPYLLFLRGATNAQDIKDDFRQNILTHFKEEGIKLDSCSDYSLYYEVCGWLETPYHYGHTTRYSTDCSGLIKGIYRQVYGTSLFGGSRDLYQQCTPINKEDLKVGDMLFFKINQERISHIGLYLGSNKFVHASTKRGVVINDLSEKYYATHYFSGGRLSRSKMNKLTKFELLTHDTIERSK